MVARLIPVLFPNEARPFGVGRGRVVRCLVVREGSPEGQRFKSVTAQCSISHSCLALCFWLYVVGLVFAVIFFSVLFFLLFFYALFVGKQKT